MDLLTALGGLVVLLTGGLWFINGKRKTAEALLTNQATKEKLLTLDQEKIKSQQTLAVEELIRTYESEQAFNRKQQDVKPEDFK